MAEIRRQYVTLRLGEFVPVDDGFLGLERLGRTTVRLWLEFPRSVPIGSVHKPDGTPREDAPRG